MAVQKPGELRSNYRGLPRPLESARHSELGLFSSGSSLGQFPAEALMRSPLLSMLGIDLIVQPLLELLVFPSFPRVTMLLKGVVAVQAGVE